jgi:excisionase family DNA binding protein
MLAHETSAGRTWKIKAEVANHYQISVRTVTGMMQRRLLPFTRLGSLVRFDLTECDRALEQFKSPSHLLDSGPVLPDGGTNKQWRTRQQIADHCHVSLRTVGNLMRKKIFPFVRVGNIVRFDLAECDLILKQLRRRSVFESESDP